MSGAGVQAALRRRAPNLANNQSSSKSVNATEQPVKPRPITIQEVVLQTKANVAILQQNYAKMNERIQHLENENSRLHQMNLEKNTVISVLESKILALEQGHVNVGTNTLDYTNGVVRDLSLELADVKNMILKLQNKIINVDYSSILKNDESSVDDKANSPNDINVRDVMLVVKQTECDVKSAAEKLIETKGDVVQSTVDLNALVANHDDEDNDDDDNNDENDENDNDEVDGNTADGTSNENAAKPKKKRNKKHK